MSRRSDERGVTLLEMLLVVVLIALLAGLSFPAVNSGLDAVRLRSAADAASSVLHQAAMKSERRQEPVEVIFDKAAGVITVRGLRAGSETAVELGEGITISAVNPEPPGPEQSVRSILLMPGAAFPRIEVVVANRRGNRKAVVLDPVTGAPSVSAVEAASQ